MQMLTGSIFQTEEARNRFGLPDKALRWRSCTAPSGHGALLSALRWSTCYLDCWASNLFRSRWVNSLCKHSLLSQHLFSIEIKLAKLQNVLSRHITINVNEFILLHPDEINEDEQQESLVPYISVTLSDPDNCTLESDSDEDDEILSDDDGPAWEPQQFILEHIDSI